jgi:hypothetical protein
MADDPLDNLEHGQDQAIIALVNEPTIRKAAEACGIGERTIYTWLEQPAFMAAYRKARREAFSQAMSLVHKYAPLAVQTLAQLLADKATPASARVTASGMLLRFSRESMEMDDVIARVEALERSTKGGYR